MSKKMNKISKVNFKKYCIYIHPKSYLLSSKFRHIMIVKTSKRSFFPVWAKENLLISLFKSDLCRIFSFYVYKIIYDIIKEKTW